MIVELIEDSGRGLVKEGAACWSRVGCVESSCRVDTVARNGITSGHSLLGVLEDKDVVL